MKFESDCHEYFLLQIGKVGGKSKNWYNRRGNDLVTLQPLSVGTGQPTPNKVFAKIRVIRVPLFPH